MQKLHMPSEALSLLENVFPDLHVYDDPKLIGEACLVEVACRLSLENGAFGDLCLERLDTAIKSKHLFAV